MFLPQVDRPVRTSPKHASLEIRLVKESWALTFVASVMVRLERGNGIASQWSVGRTGISKIIL